MNRQFFVSTNDQALFQKQSLAFENWAELNEIDFNKQFSTAAFVLMIPQQGIAGIAQQSVNQVPQVVFTILYSYYSEIEYQAAAAPVARPTFQKLQ